MQQAMQRLFVAYNQCVNRVAQTDDRMEQFRTNLRRDALELALNVKRTEQNVQHLYQSNTHIKRTLFDEVQERVKGLEERLRQVMDHEMQVSQTIDRNTHSQCASTSAIIDEQSDIRKLVEDLASRLDRSQAVSGATQNELSTNVLLDLNDLKSKVCRLTEQSTKLDGDLSFLTKLTTQVDLLEDQVVKWRHRLPELTNDESQEKIVSAVEVREELDEFKDAVYRKLREIATSLQTLQESVRLIETDKEESWEAISHKVSTLVESSVGSLTERLTELEQTVQSQRTTPVTEDDVLNMETWSTLEQVIWSELGKVKEQAQEVPNLYQMCEQFHENSRAVAPRGSHHASARRGEISEPLAYVPGQVLPAQPRLCKFLRHPLYLHCQFQPRLL